MLAWIKLKHRNRTIASDQQPYASELDSALLSDWSRGNGTAKGQCSLDVTHPSIRGFCGAVIGH